MDSEYSMANLTFRINYVQAEMGEFIMNSAWWSERIAQYRLVHYSTCFGHKSRKMFKKYHYKSMDAIQKFGERD